MYLAVTIFFTHFPQALCLISFKFLREQDGRFFLEDISLAKDSFYMYVILLIVVIQAADGR